MPECTDFDLGNSRPLSRRIKGHFVVKLSCNRLYLVVNRLMLETLCAVQIYVLLTYLHLHYIMFFLAVADCRYISTCLTSY